MLVIVLVKIHRVELKLFGLDSVSTPTHFSVVFVLYSEFGEARIIVY